MGHYDEQHEQDAQEARLKFKKNVDKVMQHLQAALSAVPYGTMEDASRCMRDARAHIKALT